MVVKRMREVSGRGVVQEGRGGWELLGSLLKSDSPLDFEVCAEFLVNLDSQPCRE